MVIAILYGSACPIGECEANLCRTNLALFHLSHSLVDFSVHFWTSHNLRDCVQSKSCNTLPVSIFHGFQSALLERIFEAITYQGVKVGIPSLILQCEPSCCRPLRYYTYDDWSARPAVLHAQLDQCHRKLLSMAWSSSMLTSACLSAGGQWSCKVCAYRGDAESQSSGGHKPQACQDARRDVIWHGKLCIHQLTL